MKQHLLTSLFYTDAICWHLDELYALSFGYLQVLKVNYSDSATPYFVHYVGWNSRWNEWISKDAVIGLADAAAGRRTSKRPAKVDKFVFDVCQF